MSSTKYKKVRKLSVAESAYVAGIIDGEGTITLTRRKRDTPRHVALTVSSTEYCILSYIHKVIGVGKITSKRAYKENHSPSYTYQVYNRQALDVIGQIYSFLKSYKRKRAALVLKKYILLTPRNGKYTPLIEKIREEFIESFFKINPH